MDKNTPTKFVSFIVPNFLDRKISNYIFNKCHYIRILMYLLRPGFLEGNILRKLVGAPILIRIGE